MSARLSYEGIHVRLGGKEILKGVSLKAEDGLVTGVIGPNGCGKSTLIKTTFGICAPRPGRVLFNGEDTAKIPPRKLASMLGYVGQDADCVFDFSVEDVVSMALYARGAAEKSGLSSGREAVRQAMEELGVWHLRKRSILSLSGGERKMVFIARAVAQGADTLILDEPTNHLDIRSQLFLMDFLKKSGKTVLVVLHDLRLASHYCDHLYLLSEGRVFAQGDPMEVLGEEKVEQVYKIQGHIREDADRGRDFVLF